MNNLIHTPEGVRDIYGPDMYLRGRLKGEMELEIVKSGYSSIQVPSFEYYSIYSSNNESGAPDEAYKFSDRDNATLAWRSDFTPGVARCCAKYFISDDLPVRLYYSGNVFNNISNLQGKFKEKEEMGCELFNEPSAMADAEIVALNSKCIKKCGIKDFRIILSHVDFIYGIFNEAGIHGDDKAELCDVIAAKDQYAIDRCLERLSIDDHFKKLISKLPFMNTDIDILKKMSKEVTNERSLSAIKRLNEVYKFLKSYKAADKIGFDLGMLPKYKYYTGIIFNTYASGCGEQISKGGRYDDLMERFGTKASAVGFVIDVDALISADDVKKQDKLQDANKRLRVFLYKNDPKSMKTAITGAEKCRKDFESVELIPIDDKRGEDFEAYLSSLDREKIRAIHLVDGDKVKIVKNYGKKAK